MAYSTYKHTQFIIIFSSVFMMKRTTLSTYINNDQKVNKKSCIKHEVQAYIIDTNNNYDLRPLEWRRVNGGKYYNVSRVVQMWLAVTETSTPNKRVFSICGLVDTV